jgi:hypothetical protein
VRVHGAMKRIILALVIVVVLVLLCLGARSLYIDRELSRERQTISLFLEGQGARFKDVRIDQAKPGLNGITGRVATEKDLAALRDGLRHLEVHRYAVAVRVGE